MQPLLSDLCSICHKSPPKYRCPACSTRTCSLDCVQKHKSWGCSGKRDPTAYVKKNQLATPAGVDHDYNFIAGIEQSRDRADEQLQGRSIHDADSRSARLNQPAFRNRLQLAGVHVEYAPLGMTRQKVNRTRLTKSKRINWTVEWRHADGTASIGTIFDDEQIATAYLALYRRRTGAPRTKRKRDDGPQPPGSPANSQDVHSAPRRSGVSPVAGHGVSSTLKRDHEEAKAKESIPKIGEDDSQALDTVTSHSAVGLPDPAHVIGDEPLIGEGDVEIKSEPELQQDVVDSSSLDQGSSLYYYIVIPRTAGSEMVVSPLSGTDTFLTCLRDRTVLEFPTIQVLAANPAALPTGYVTEDEYLARFKKQAHEMEQLVKEEGEIEVETDQKPGHQIESRSDAIIADAGPEAMPDSSTLLATLKRDML